MDGATFKCPACGKTYVNRADIAGKKMTCECARIIDVPEFAGASQESYEFVEEWEPKARKKPTVAKQPVSQSEESSEYTPPKKGTVTDRYGPRKAVDHRLRGDADRDLERVMHERAGRMWMTLATVAFAIIGVIVWGARHRKSIPPAPQLRPDDQTVIDEMNDSGATEATEWLKSKKHSVLGWSNAQAAGHIKTWYSLGAEKVLAFGEAVAGSFAIELPADAKKRAALFAWQNDYASDTHQKAVADEGQKYLVIELKF